MLNLRNVGKIMSISAILRLNDSSMVNWMNLRLCGGAVAPEVKLGTFKLAGCFLVGGFRFSGWGCSCLKKLNKEGWRILIITRFENSNNL